MAGEYGTQITAAQRQLEELKAQEQAILERLAAASQAVSGGPPISKQSGNRNPNDPNFVAAQEKLEATQKELEAIQKQRQAAEFGVAKLTDLNKKDASTVSSAEKNAAALVKQRMDNQEAGLGYYTDPELDELKRKDDAIKRAQEDRSDRNTLGNRQITSAEQRQKDSQSFQERMQENRIGWERDALEANAKLKRGELTLREAQLTLEKAYNDRQIAQQNILAQARAANELNTMGVTQRAQDVNLMDRGQASVLGVMEFVERRIDMMEPGQIITEEQTKQMIKEYMALVVQGGKDTINAVPRETPSATTTSMAAGEMYVGGIGETVYVSREDLLRRQQELEDKEGTVTDPAEASKLAFEGMYLDWALARQNAGETEQPTLDSFRQHLTAIGKGEEELPTQEQFDPLVKLPMPAPVPYTAPAPAPAPATETVAAPTTPGQAPVIIPITVTGSTTGQPAVDPTGGAAQQEQIANMQIKKQMHEDAAASQTVGLMKEQGFDPGVIQEFQSRHGNNGLQANPFNDYLESQLGQPSV